MSPMGGHSRRFGGLCRRSALPPIATGERHRSMSAKGNLRHSRAVGPCRLFSQQQTLRWRVCSGCDTKTKAEWPVIGVEALGSELAGGAKTRDYPLTRNQCVDVDRGATPCCLVVISSTAHSAPAPALPWQRWI